jgi:DNA-binding PadR family transcriptional regulator
MKNKDNLSLSLLDHHILVCIGDRTLYGREILLELNVGRPIQLAAGSVYPALDRGVEKGMLRWRWGDDDEASCGARRKYFTATEAGKQALEIWEKYRESLGIGEQK